MKNSERIESIHADDIVIPDFIAAEDPRPGEEQLERSMAKTRGARIPLLILRHEGVNYLVKGARRLKVGRKLGFPKYDCAIVEGLLPGKTLDGSIRKLRVVMDNRQDLLPSARAKMVEELKTVTGWTNEQTASALGVDADTITNWTAIKRYAPEVVQSIDSGAITLQSARVFNGMTEKGQAAVMQEFGPMITGDIRPKRKELVSLIREAHPPQKNPEFYTNPDLIAKKLATSSKGRKRRPRVVAYTTDEKRTMLSSLRVKEAELREFKDEYKRLKNACIAGGKLASAILRTKAVQQFIPEPMREELEEFAKRYGG